MTTNKRGLGHKCGAKIVFFATNVNLLGYPKNYPNSYSYHRHGWCLDRESVGHPIKIPSRVLPVRLHPTVFPEKWSSRKAAALTLNRELFV